MKFCLFDRCERSTAKRVRLAVDIYRIANEPGLYLHQNFDSDEAACKRWLEQSLPQ